MSTDRQALIESIRSHPAEDTPRLVLADWFEENGQSARGEFIRVQCELATTDRCSPRYPELHLRELALLAEHERDWLGAWADRLVRWEFRRGMLDEVTVQPEPFCQGGEELFRNHPIWRVAFVDELGESLAPEPIRDVLSQPHARYLRAINAAGCKPDEQAAAWFGGRVHTSDWLLALARAPAVVGLRELGLFGGTRQGRAPIDPAAWREFCAAGHLRGLTHLDLATFRGPHGGEPSDESICRDLAEAGFGAHLVSLGINGTDHRALWYLVRSGQFPRLRSLVVGHPQPAYSITALINAILDPETLPGLRDLTLPFGDYLTEFTDHPGWRRIERLGFGCQLRDQVACERAWRALCQSTHLNPTAIRLLNGWATTLPRGFWAELASASWFRKLSELAVFLPANSDCRDFFAHPSPEFPRLRSLDLFSPGPELVERLIAWPGLANLVELNLNGGSYWGEPATNAELFESGSLSPRLTTLRVSGICWSAVVVQALARCAALAGVRHLDFAFNELAPKSAAELTASPYLRHLKSLHTWSEGSEFDPSWLRLADPNVFPQLRDVVIGDQTSESVRDELRRRFGPRLRVFVDNPREEL